MRTFCCVLLAGLMIPIAYSAHADDTESLFEAPVEITAGGNPISDLYYPSPVVYDLDGDGTRELILGDLSGFLYVCTAEESGDDLRWSARQHLEADGKPLKLHNW